MLRVWWATLSRLLTFPQKPTPPLGPDVERVICGFSIANLGGKPAPMAQHFAKPVDEDDPVAVFRHYANALNARSWRWPLLGPSYHLFADALYWIDEAPPLSKLRKAENALRFLWHFRTGLIMGEEREGAELWQLGKQLFPLWVGFHPSRCAPLRQYKIVYRAGRMATAKCLADLEREIESA
jgi:hypothetical protein